MSNSSNGLMGYINRLGFEWEEVLSSALTLFVRRQNPEKVKFVKHRNEGEVVGYSIKVKTSEENTEDALEFWKEYVIPKLNGDGK